MSRRSFTSLGLATLGVLMTLAPHSASACAACFGRSDSKLAEGMNMGIFSLLVVVLFVLGGVASFFVYLARRSAMLAQATPAPSQSTQV